MDFLSQREFREGLVPFKCLNKGDGWGKWGYLDQQGRVVIAPAFKSALDFSEGLAPVRPEGSNNYGFIDKTGKLVIQPQFEQVWPFTEGKAMVKLSGVKPEPFMLAYHINHSAGSMGQVSPVHGDLRYVNAKGELLDGLYFEVKPGWKFYNSRAAMKIEDKYGYIDETGKLLIAAQYDTARDFSEKLAAVQINGKYGFIDTSGKMVIPAKFDFADSFKDGIARVLIRGGNSPDKELYIDKAGKEVKVDKKKLKLEYSEGLAAGVVETKPKVKNGRIELPDPDSLLKVGYLDENGKQVIPAKFYGARKFSQGLACVCVHDAAGKELFGYIDKKGSFAVEPRFSRVVTSDYEYGVDFSEDLAVVLLPGSRCYGYIDKKGNWVFEPQFGVASEFCEGVACVGTCGGLACIDKQGQRLALKWWRVYEPTTH